MRVTIPLYVINLDRSADRLPALIDSARASGFDFRRIRAFDGLELDISAYPEIDESAFRYRHGKKILPGEAGCYLSHLQALRQVAEGDEDYAVIVEDDVAFLAHAHAVVQAICSYEGFDIVKLANHRYRGFRPFVDIGYGYWIGRFLHGPQGSAAAYLVSKKGAAKLLQCLTPMCLPYDVALERGWSGFEIFSLDHDLVGFLKTSGSTIAHGRKYYRMNRLPFYKRIGTFFFRLGDYARRIVYGLKPNRLKKKTGK